MLLNISKVLYEIGFFSLAKKAEEKIIYKNQYFDNLNDLETSYSPKTVLTKEDEIFFAKAYSSIFFDNSASEVSSELLKNKEKYLKNDYYHYLLSQSYFEQKDYHKALTSINKAISLNSENVRYKLVKADILSASKKYSDSLKIINKLEKNQKIIDLKSAILIKKQVLISQYAKNDKEKKYSAIYKTFLEGNFEKTKKDCLYALNFNKDNDKIISLYAKAELASGNIERANSYFTNSYKVNKSNIDTLIGLGDIHFLHKDYKGAVKLYKKALGQDTSSAEILLKLSTAQKEYGKDLKALKKTDAKLNKQKIDYLTYYNCAISLVQKNTVLKEDFLKKSLSQNPLYKLSAGEEIALDLYNKNYKNAKALIDLTAFTLEKNYYYYYLLGLYNQALGNNQDAIEFYKTSLDLNPAFEIANIKLLKLIPKKEEI